MAGTSSTQGDDQSAPKRTPLEAEGGDGAMPSAFGDEEREELEELRRLLLAPEQQRLDRLEQREVEVREVSELLPDAVVLRTRQDQQLVRALGPVIEDTLRVTVQRDPQSFADALFPIFGPAIRKSLREALRAMMEMINRTVESRLSPQAFRWRLEAWQTGLSYSEVVLRHTLHYRVEQVFLVDEETGLPLQHVAAEAVDVQDTSLVSSMLTAIENFAQDSFGTSEEASLDVLEIGALTVWIEQGPRAYLAAVIRGIPAPELRDVMVDVIETIHLRFREELEAFDGDSTPFHATRPLLEPMLLARYKREGRATSPMLWILGGLLVAAVGSWLFFSLRERSRWDQYLTLLKAEPGVVVTEHRRAGGNWYVRGLRDPLARDPAVLLAETSLQPAEVHGEWGTYQALDSAFVLRRASFLLEPPPTVTLRFRAGTLAASGAASPPWIDEARRRARFVAGVTAYDDTALDNGFGDLIDALERETVRFVGGQATLTNGQEGILDSLIVRLRRVQTTLQGSGRQVRLQVLGHVSTEGDPGANRLLSRHRADAIRDVLIQRGLPADLVGAVGTGQPRFEGSEQTEAERAANRSVSFKIVLQ